MPAKKDFKPKQQLDQYSDTHTLPIHRPCIIYARQSSTKQTVENLESALYQTEGLYKKALALGWTDDLITLMVENQQADGTVKGVSGALRIDQRPGLSVVVNSIKADEVGAILAMNESRLFRDEWAVEYNTFAKECYEHNVLILTDHYTYDFVRRSFDIDIFRRQCEIAAAYNKHHVKGVLVPLRKRAAMRGKFDGRCVSMGYIVDYRKTVNGEPNHNYKRFIVYEPHAKIIRWIFRRYRELGGNFSRLGRELEAMPYVFPEFEQGVRPNKTVLKKVPGGYSVGRGGLHSILTSPVYLGHWMVDGYIVRYNNHAAIVDEEDFMYAFNRLSPYTMDGEENVDRPASPMARYHQQGKPESDALLKDVITSSDSNVHVAPYRGKWYYTMDIKGYGFSKQHASLINADILDSAFTERLMHWLSAQYINSRPHTTNFAVPGEFIDNDMLAKMQRVSQHPALDLDGHIAQYKTLLSGKIATLSLPPDILDATTRAEFARDAMRLRGIIAELEQKRDNSDKERKKLEESATLLQRAEQEWKKWSLEEKKRFISIVTSRISISLASAHWMKIEIDWIGPISYTDTGYLYRTKAASMPWSDEEDNIIRALYPNAERHVVLERLPNRTWGAIIGRAMDLGVSRTMPATRGIATVRTVAQDDIQFMGSVGIPVQEGMKTLSCYWMPATDENNMLVRASNYTLSATSYNPEPSSLRILTVASSDHYIAELRSLLLSVDAL